MPASTMRRLIYLRSGWRIGWRRYSMQPQQPLRLHAVAAVNRQSERLRANAATQRCNYSPKPKAIWIFLKSPVVLLQSCADMKARRGLVIADAVQLMARMPIFLLRLNLGCQSPARDGWPLTY